ncbi:hypothetical protein SAMN05192562_10760 [Kosakonia arachidis]|uniref:Uncharacterized protein n=1 Tax=Kosakonia arachidis TaxID=551989 RepID=A0A1I7DVP5_9ENTR|nr:hypothetical protein SAMN05192562_10760 [Kosakonia arachidis]
MPLMPLMQYQDGSLQNREAMSKHKQFSFYIK